MRREKRGEVLLSYYVFDDVKELPAIAITASTAPGMAASAVTPLKIVMLPAFAAFPFS